MTLEQLLTHYEKELLRDRQILRRRNTFYAMVTLAVDAFLIPFAAAHAVHGFADGGAFGIYIGIVFLFVIFTSCVGASISIRSLLHFHD